MILRHLYPVLLTGLLLSALPAQVDADKLVIPKDKDPVTTSSGLKYSVLRAGAGGLHPKMHDEVTVHYTGWLEDGTIFDSSVKRGEPSKFRLGRVIKGWNEGLTKITVGGKIKLTIPSDLAYGDTGNSRIPAKATLIFQIELLALSAVPVYTEPDPEKQKKIASGLTCQVIQAGTGDVCGSEAAVHIRFALWSGDKKLQDCSDFYNQDVKLKITSAPLPFLKEVLPLMKAGEIWRIDVPAKHGGGRTGVWHVEVISVQQPLSIPEFKLPTAEELKTTASGLQMMVVAAGEGMSPTRQDSVSCHYAGWRKRDGKLFDSSFGRGEPTTFSVGGVIPGWTEALLSMKAGGKVWLVIPAKLAYGKRGAGGDIGPDEDLVFYMELVAVK
ncbi:MAG: FKBP-type peptidyl-prolyl cis-trans isomerase [Planctomycetes bacterium]|nr:FKBP-type peptidyl-prolyl cis-trans isomerase [Planctomycetota bacterium]